MAITPFTDEERRNWFASLPAKVCGAAVVCINDQQEMLVVKASYKSRWSLPGGSSDQGESPRATALRELTEETGVELSASDVEFAGLAHLLPANKRDSLYFLFIARGVRAIPKPDGHEILEAKWMKPDEFKKLAGDRPHSLLAADIVKGASPVGTYIEATI